jgi:hypothetical protein
MNLKPTHFAYLQYYVYFYCVFPLLNYPPSITLTWCQCERLIFIWIQKYYTSIVALRVVDCNEKGTRCLGINCATLSLGDINTGTWSSMLGVDLYEHYCCEIRRGENRIKYGRIFLSKGCFANGDEEIRRICNFCWGNILRDWMQENNLDPL